MQKRAAWVCLLVGLCLVGEGTGGFDRALGIMGDENPTARDGRGAPRLDDPFRAAAWVLVDGKSGKFREESGGPLAQWIIEDPVSNTPTFRVMVHEPLLGSKVEFQAVVQLVQDPDEKGKTFALRAKAGKFEAGKDYKLLEPGEDFEVREAGTDKLVTSIDPLASGQYLIAAVVTGTEKKSATAITYFKVE